MSPCKGRAKNKGNAEWIALALPRVETPPARLRLTREDALRQSSNYTHAWNRRTD